MWPICEYGTHEQKMKYVPDLASGKIKIIVWQTDI